MKTKTTNKGKTLGGFSMRVQKKSGIKHKLESYNDVLKACDKYLRDRGMIKSIREMRNDQFERRAK